MITLSYSKLKKFAFCILGLPFIVFAIGWMKWYWAVIAVGATLLCIYFGAFRKRKNAENKVVELSEAEHKVSVKYLFVILIIAIAMIWVWQSGIGGFWAQSKDYPWRNAIYRDIVLRDWPVFYDVYGGALVYYIGYWLVPALFGKLALLLGANDVAAFQVASVAIYIWSVLLIVLLFGLLITLLRADTSKKQLLIVLGFVFFSGLDILGSIEPLGANLYHLEWWADYYQYSSFTTCLFWVFNQSMIPWIAFACLLQEKTIKNYVFLGMMCLFSGPLPFIGYFIFCIALGIQKGIKAIRNKQAGTFFKDIVSVSNMLAVFFVFIFIATFLLSNAALSGGGALRIDQDATIVQSEMAVGTEADQVNLSQLKNYVLFVLFEFGIYAALIARKYYKEPLFYVTIVPLFIFPFLKIGGGSDFPMRASIPALFLLYCFIMKFLMEEKLWLKKKGSTQRMLYIILIVTLLLGSITPVVEFYRGARQVALYGLDNPMEDYLYTLGGDGPNGWDVESGQEFANFVAIDAEQKFFFHYFAKDVEK